MDTAPALLDAARETGGLDLERLRVDFGSNAIVERFGADLERGRGATTPTVRVRRRSTVEGYGPYERLREAALAAGAEPAGDGHPGRRGRAAALRADGDARDRRRLRPARPARAGRAVAARARVARAAAARARRRAVGAAPDG